MLNDTFPLLIGDDDNTLATFTKPTFLLIMQILYRTVKQKKINDDCEQTLCSIVELQDFIPEVYSLYSKQNFSINAAS